MFDLKGWGAYKPRIKHMALGTIKKCQYVEFCAKLPEQRAEWIVHQTIATETRYYQAKEQMTCTHVCITSSEGQIRLIMRIHSSGVAEKTVSYPPATNYVIMDHALPVTMPTFQTQQG